MDMLVLHYTDMLTAEEACGRMCDPQAQVSAHYLIDTDGSVVRLVDEEKRAWHAGVSYWGGERDINSRSIGIELQNPGHSNGYVPFPEPQMQALIDLCRDILQRHPILPGNILGHSDIAPDRKRDPGELLDWKMLAENGIGIFPDPDEGTAGNPALLRETLTAIGYDPDSERAVEAFQRRYRPARIDNEADVETTTLAEVLLHSPLRQRT